MKKKILRTISGVAKDCTAALEYVRSRDERTKRRYLVAFSCVAMVIVVALWTRYFTEVVLRPVYNEPQFAETSDDLNPAVWDTLTGSAATAYRNITSIARATITILKTPQNYDVKPQE